MRKAFPLSVVAAMVMVFSFSGHPKAQDDAALGSANQASGVIKEQAQTLGQSIRSRAAPPPTVSEVHGIVDEKAVGSVTLSPDQIQALDSLAKMIARRPNLLKRRGFDLDHLRSYYSAGKADIGYGFKPLNFHSNVRGLSFLASAKKNHSFKVQGIRLLLAVSDALRGCVSAMGSNSKGDAVVSPTECRLLRTIFPHDTKAVDLEFNESVSIEISADGKGTFLYSKSGDSQKGFHFIGNAAAELAEVDPKAAELAEDEINYWVAQSVQLSRPSNQQ